MGKVAKRSSFKHSNHHDNPRQARKAITRRQHSQNGPLNQKPKKVQPAQSVSTRGPISKSHIHTKPLFSKWDAVLMVGEGDFSFALSVALHHPYSKLVATCFDSKDVLEEKYPNVNRTLQRLCGDGTGPNTEVQIQDLENGKDEWNGFSASEGSEHAVNDAVDRVLPPHHKSATIMYGMNATKLSTTHQKALKPYSPFTKIIFNFPHVGGLSTDVNRQVRANQQLLVEFFASAKHLLATGSNPAKMKYGHLEDELDEYENELEDRQQAEYAKHGQILVTLFEGEPYTLWNVRDLARHSGLKVLESFKFPWAAYPGYQHARTIGDITHGKDRSTESKRKGAWRGEERDARCYVLALKEDDDGRPGPGSRKRKKHDDDSD